MHSYTLPNGFPVDIDGCIQAVLAKKEIDTEFPVFFFDTEKGEICSITSAQDLVNLVKKIGTSARYREITFFKEKEYNDIMKDFLEMILFPLAKKELMKRADIAFKDGGWKNVVKILEKDKGGWMDSWDTFLQDEAYESAIHWLMNLPDVTIQQKFVGCGDCMICDAVRDGKESEEVLSEAFTAQNSITVNSFVQKSESDHIKKKTAKVRSTQKVEKVFQLKISLDGSRPLIWRRIIVPSTYTFFDLHVAIQDAMGWYDCHLHQFFDKSPHFPSRDYKIITYPHEEVGMPMVDVAELDETKTYLCDFLKKEKDTVTYEYDFGDSWMHTVMLEKIIPYEKGMKLPDIVSGKNMCPWEDSGALWGFYDKIEILKNKKGRDYKYIKEWAMEVHGYEKDEEIDITFFNKEAIEWNDPKKRLEEYRKRY